MILVHPMKEHIGVRRTPAPPGSGKGCLISSMISMFITLPKTHKTPGSDGGPGVQRIGSPAGEGQGHEGSGLLRRSPESSATAGPHLLHHATGDCIMSKSVDLTCRLYQTRAFSRAFLSGETHLNQTDNCGNSSSV